jgi:hypothetical protein
MELLISDRQLCNDEDYGLVPPKTPFQASDEVAKQLLEKGLARRVNPKITYQTKVVRPAVTPEVVAEAEPFRNVRVHHQEPPAVAAEGDRVLPLSDVSKQGTPDRGGRGPRR